MIGFQESINTPGVRQEDVIFSGGAGEP